MSRRADASYNLAILYTSIAEEWDTSKNKLLTPFEVTPSSAIKVWWICSKGHSWKAAIYARTNNRSGCPYCFGRFATSGNNLLTKNPSLAREWNFEKNVPLKPQDVRSNSNKNVWWHCSKGHEWQASINSRNNGRGCPYCAHKKVNLENCLQTKNPSLAEEWNKERNGNLTPFDVMPGTNKKVWWKCKLGHEWSAMINSRSRGSGCPSCSRFLLQKKLRNK